MKLNASNFIRLYSLSTEPNESDHYSLEPFSDNNAALNQDIEEDSINESLDELADGGSWHEITDDSYADEGKIHIDIGDDGRIEIRDITDSIDCESEKSRFFVLVDVERSEYEWIVAVPSGTVYSD
jgi:hypothetical protein